MKYETILKNFKSNKYTVEYTLELLAKIGYSPALVNDDNGHWAVSFEGVQTVNTGNSGIDTSIIIFVEKKNWKKTIREALLESFIDYEY